MKCFWFLVFAFLLIACKSHSSNTVTLAQNGKSEYEIYISPKAENSLKDAVSDFQKYFYKISGVRLPVTNKKQSQHQIVIGDDAFVRGLDVDIPFDQIKPDGFIIKTRGTNLFISGISEQGVINGIYTFLEKYLGCRYYARGVLKIPEKDSVIFKDINDLQNPAFQVRMLHAYDAFSKGYAKWRKLTLPPRKNSFWAKPWIHTTTKYINPKWMFDDHPEYFMLSNGERIPAEIDFANKKILNIIINKVEDRLRKNPKIEHIGISQADVTTSTKKRAVICECNQCSLVSKKDIPSAVIINFVNKVAAAFPEKTINTLAYQYSRTPPVSLKPKDNVMIIVVNTANNSLRAAENKSFIKDLKGWQEITDNIMVWDYMVNLTYPISPYPNLYHIPQKLKAYKELGVTKLFPQGSGHDGAEFGELRSYLLSKLMWNIEADVDAIITDFLTGFYGEAAPYIKKYIDEMHAQLNNSNKRLIRIFDPTRNVDSFLSLNSLKRYEEYFKKAKESVQQNEKLLTRVDKAQQPLRYARISIYREILNKKNNVKQKLNISITEYNNLVKEFVKKTKKYNAKKIGRGVKSPDTFLQLNSIENK